MGCPFLKEVRVRTCGVAPVRKLIVLGPGAAIGEEKCLSGEHSSCDLFQRNQNRLDEGGAGGFRCPFLEQKQVQYCLAAPIPKYVPCAPLEASRCTGNTFRYCETFLSIARPRAASDPDAEGIAVPERLYFSPNHMWIDLGEGGVCHLGIDGLLARVLGTIERIEFVTVRGSRRPSAVVTCRTVDWPMVFPSNVLVERPNAYARADPSRITKDPYGAGWLFEARLLPGRGNGDPGGGLVRGSRALAWMSDEVRRLNESLHALYAQQTRWDGYTANNGGCLVEGVSRFLSREELLGLLSEFFAPNATWERDQVCD